MKQEKKKRHLQTERNKTRNGKRKGNPEECKYLHPRESGCADWDRN